MEDTTESIRLKMSAHQKPLIVTPSISLSANKMIRALITNKNKPSVTIVIGNVRTRRIGFTKVLSSAKTIASIMASVNFGICTPSKTMERP